MKIWQQGELFLQLRATIEEKEEAVKKIKGPGIELVYFSYTRPYIGPKKKLFKWDPTSKNFLIERRHKGIAKCGIVYV